MSRFLDFLSLNDAFTFYNYDVDQISYDITTEPHIYIEFRLTEEWLFNSYFIKQEFIDVLSEFNKVYIEIDFKSDFFDSIIGAIVNMQKKDKCKIAASVIFDNPLQIKATLKQHNIIEIVKINVLDFKKNCLECFDECASMKYFILNGDDDDDDDIVINCIKDNAFKNCLSLQEFSLNQPIEIIGRNAFQGCISCRKISCPYGSCQIKMNAFQGCFTLKTITLGNIKVIESNAFEGCTSLKYVKIKNIGKLCSNAFKGCYSLTEIRTNHIGTIESNAFEGCTSLETIDVDDINIIHSNAFDGCSSLKVINAKIWEIGSYSFRNCRSLEVVIIHNYKLNTIEEGVFEGCSSLKTIKILFHDFVGPMKQIKKKAFKGCSSLINTPANFDVEIIEEYAFENCLKLEYFDLSNTKEIRSSCFLYCTSLRKSEIPNNINYIPTFAFYGCSSLTSLKIPKSVNVIDDYAFGFCRSLKEVILPSSLQKIGLKAFYFCVSLLRISIPKSVKSIGLLAFYGCSRLEAIFLPSFLNEKSLGLNDKVVISKN